MDHPPSINGHDCLVDVIPSVGVEAWVLGVFHRDILTQVPLVLTGRDIPDLKVPMTPDGQRQTVLHYVVLGHSVVGVLLALWVRGRRNERKVQNMIYEYEL